VFGELVRAHRRRLGWTQEELAEVSGVTVRSIGKIEGGRIAAPRPATVRLLADALGLQGADRERFQEAAVAGATAADRATGRTADRAGTDATPPPAQLPPDVSAFTGRGGEIAELDRLLATVGQGWTAVVISAVSGTAGVGKTALAVHWAHRVADRFPDGQLYVDLRGYDPDQVMAAGDALAGFLRALGVDGPRIPAEVAERGAQYRTLLARRRMLVVLDNAASAEQVRPLLPGSTSCLVLVTSRDSLAALVARHGARRLGLDRLPPHDAVDLLRTLIGERVDADPEAAAALAGQCAHLPLALRVGAELAVARAGVPLADLVAELGDEQRRLDLMDADGDPRTAVRAVFSWSYRRLPAAAARVFRLLGLPPGADIDAHAVAALTGTGVDEARESLDVLCRPHLADRAGPGRYGMHDLLCAYAAGLAGEHDGAGHRQAALTRLFDHYVATAAAATDILDPGADPALGILANAPVPPLNDPTAALAWLDAERANLVAVSGYAAGHGWPTHATRLAASLFRYLDAGGHQPDALTIHGNARHAAAASGDREAEATALVNLGVVQWGQARYDEAAEHLRQARDLYHETGNHGGEARAWGNLGGIYEQQGHYPQAITHHRQALILYQEIGNDAGQGFAVSNLGLIYGRQGRYDEALDHHEQALALARKTTGRYAECLALGNLGIVHSRLGEHDQATDCYRQALAIARELGDRNSEAYLLTNLGVAQRRQGRYDAASEHHERALAIFGEIGDRSGEAEALNGLGEVRNATGRSSEARTRHAAALALAVDADNRYEQARAHSGLGHAYQSAGHADDARQHWQQALALYVDLGSTEADDIRGELAGLDADRR
jgi:tetratricopeptide (TPR) repeat protein/transcriptional regulator with XRE-family HTH domain